MRKSLIIAAMTALFAVAAVANPALFTKYETVRQAMLKDSIADAKKAALTLAKDARAAKQTAVAAKADAVAKSKDIKAAREAFGALSDEMIKFRATAKGAKPAVYTCPMVKKDWLQAKGTVGNPYDASMRQCGMIKAE
jgi:hypothetical protein